MMRTAFLSMVVLLVAGSYPCQQAKSTSDQRVENVESGLVPFNPAPPSDGVAPQRKSTLAERMAEYKIPGVSVAIIEDGQVALAKGYGNRKAGQDTPVTTDTLFEAASTTKMLTAVLALHCVEKGLIALDEDLNRYLKSWKIPTSELAQTHKVTLRLLLTHQAGLNGPQGGFSWEDGKVPTLVQVLKGEPPAQNKAVSVESVPGARWQYSNFGYVVVQLLLEDLTGKPFPRLASEVIFRPLGMESSTLVYPLKAELGAREALPHDSEGKVREAVMHPTAMAQGGLVTTPSDLARLAIELARAYQGKSDRVLSQRTARLMFEKELDLDPALLGFPMAEGLGVFLRGAGPDFSFLHPGDNFPGASCWLVGFPALGKGAVIMTNGAKGNLLAMELIAAIGKEYRWPVP